MGESEPLVTIAVPTYNRPAMLRDAVASALAQSYRHIEVLVGDNAAADEVRLWCDNLRQQDARVRYQAYARNLGMAGNWNALADAARGEFFVLLADDDRLCPEFVATLLSAVKQHSAHVAFCNHHVIDSDGLRLHGQGATFAEVYNRRELQDGLIANPEICVWQNSISIAACLLRTADVREVRFKEDLNTPELEFFTRLFRKERRLVFNGQFLAEYRIHGGSGTAAGLWIDRLAGYLIVAAVRPDVEPLKRRLLRPLLISAVNRCLEQGKQLEARRLLASPYYPRPKWINPQAIVQSICAVAPPAVSQVVFAISRGASRAIARRTS